MRSGLASVCCQIAFECTRGQAEPSMRVNSPCMHARCNMLSSYRTRTSTLRYNINKFESASLARIENNWSLCPQERSPCLSECCEMHPICPIHHLDGYCTPLVQPLEHLQRTPMSLEGPTR